MELEIELIEVWVFCLEQVAHFGVLGRALGQCFVSAFIRISFELICKWLVTGRLSASAPKSDGCGAKVEIWIWIVDAALCCLGRPPVIDSSAAWGTSASAECRPRETSHRGVAVDGNLVDLFLFLFIFFGPLIYFFSCSRNWNTRKVRWTALQLRNQVLDSDWPDLWLWVRNGNWFNYWTCGTGSDGNFFY